MTVGMAVGGSGVGDSGIEVAVGAIDAVSEVVGVASTRLVGMFSVGSAVGFVPAVLESPVGMAVCAAISVRVTRGVVRTCNGWPQPVSKNRTKIANVQRRTVPYFPQDARYL